ncbi:Mitomycin radical oxidase [Corynebacterium occultum]|uniref:Mitomycin radical oxidase n=1 Tax=Corynebacterium occultum TaxID=2675219 RepID=A0A6B8VT70_9CORY|nr:BBE domain-containing protein [Corynebacterium occultum]QGU07333.1 Mitomycin radical oxidase [Corynebacterium occultum]
MTRTAGLSLDQLLAADLVTASGEHLHASAEENAELFWGIRGCGGNFGVITSFTFRSLPIPAGLLGANFLYRPENWRSALDAFEQWGRELPDEINPIISILVMPPEMEMGDAPWLIIGCNCFGEDERIGREQLARLREAAPPDVEDLRALPWTEWQSAMDDLFPTGSRGYWKNVSFSRLDAEVVDVLLDFASELTWQGTGIDIHLMGGYFGRVDEDATAFPNRSARFWLNVYGFWHDPAEDERLSAYARKVYAAMQPFAEHGEYINFLGAETEHDLVAATRRAYGPEKYQRLVALKDRYDPENLFRLNHNIAPTPA